MENNNYSWRKFSITLISLLILGVFFSILQQESSTVQLKTHQANRNNSTTQVTTQEQQEQEKINWEGIPTHPFVRKIKKISDDEQIQKQYEEKARDISHCHREFQDHNMTLKDLDAQIPQQYRFNNPEPATIPQEQTQAAEQHRLDSHQPGLWQNMRIHVDFSMVEQNQKNLRDSWITFIQDAIMKPAQAFLESSLKVYPLSKPIKFLANQCHLKRMSPVQMLKGVENADLVIFVHIVQSRDFKVKGDNCHQGTLNTVSGRTTVMQLLFSSTIIEEVYSNPKQSQAWIDFALHEITHSILFNPVEFEKFRDENGNIRGKDKVVKTIDSQQFLITPKLIAYAQTFFGCTGASQGVPLENGGNLHESGQHFEKINFGYEAMTATLNLGSKSISEFTFILFEESGWYLPNYERAQPFSFGQGDGCDFMNGSCPTNSKVYCHNNFLGCSFDMEGIGECKTDMFSMGCPFHSLWREGSCMDKKGKYTEIFDSIGGRADPNSACFVTDLPSQFKGLKIDKQQLHAGCYPSHCAKNGNNLEIQVFVNNKEFKCTANQQVLTNVFYGQGTITCPDNLEQFCNFDVSCQAGCNRMGTCRNGKCQCYPGFTGDDCSQVIEKS